MLDVKQVGSDKTSPMLSAGHIEEDNTLVKSVSANGSPCFSVFRIIVVIRDTVLVHLWGIHDFGAIGQIHVFHLLIDNTNKCKMPHAKKWQNMVDPNVGM